MKVKTNIKAGRRGRGADDAPGHNRKGQGTDDLVPHGAGHP